MFKTILFDLFLERKGLRILSQYLVIVLIMKIEQLRETTELESLKNRKMNVSHLGLSESFIKIMSRYQHFV